MSYHVTCIASCNNHVFVIMNIACCTQPTPPPILYIDCIEYQRRDEIVCHCLVLLNTPFADWNCSASRLLGVHTLYVLNMFALTTAVSISRFSDGMDSDSVSNDSYRSFLTIRTFCNFDAFNFHRRRAVCCFQTKRSLITKIRMKERRGRRRRKTDN